MSRHGDHTPVGLSDPSESTVAVHVEPVKRCGKVPPLDVFEGENAEIRFEHRLLSLEQAGPRNGWTPDEKLIQLAGHLQGKAWQKWNLLDDRERATFCDAVKAMKELLGCNKI